LIQEATDMTERHLRILASTGLVVGGVLGMAGTFAPTASLRGLAWGIDGTALVMAASILAILFYRKGHDLAAAGFVVFAIGEGLVLACSAMDPAASTPLFGAGTSLWAMALLLVSLPRTFPAPARIAGFAGAVAFGLVAGQIFSGVPLTPLSSPLPFFAYPILVANLLGWTITVLKAERV
jgi:hypothetical protein